MTDNWNRPPNEGRHDDDDDTLQGMELFIPSSVVLYSVKSRPWIGKSCNKASRRKQDWYQAWAAVQAAEDANSDNLKKQ